MSLPDREREASSLLGPAVLQVGLLTGADDLSYALGLTSALAARGIEVDFIGSDRIDAPELHTTPLVNFLNLRGDQSQDVPMHRKMARVLAYYLRLMSYAVSAKPRLFHVLWNNKFEFFDRTVLMLFYGLLGRRVVLTAHNVNAAKRDGRDTAFNRLSLRIQYRLSRHIFVHTAKMKVELLADFGVHEHKVSVIPFGINNTTPITSLTGLQARTRLGIGADDKVMLFFGQIAPYKGLEYLVETMPDLMQGDKRLRLVIAGKVKSGCDAYWQRIWAQLSDSSLRSRVTTRIEHIPDHDVEIYFKSADVLIVPYVQIFQSGVPFLAYSFGLPVVATDVGSLRDDIIEGKTGWVCPPRSPPELAQVIRRHFDSELFYRLDASRAEIRAHANERHSWSNVAGITESVYRRALARGRD